MSRTMPDARVSIVIAAATLVFAGCGEIPQDAAKPFAGKEETRSYAGKSLDARSETMNEYLITQDAKAEPARAVRAAEGSSPTAVVK